MYRIKHPEVIKYHLTSPLIVTASYDRARRIKVWTERAKSAELIQQFDFFDSQVNSMALHKNFLAIAGFDSIKIFDISTNQKELVSYFNYKDEREVPANEEMFPFPFNHHDEHQHHPNHHRVNRQQKLYKCGKRNEMKIIFSNDGNSLFSCNERGIITWWSFVMPKMTITKQINVDKIISSIALHPNQEMLAIIAESGEIYFWTFKDSCIPFPFNHVDNSLISADFSNDGKYLAVMNTKGSVWIWNDFSLKSQQLKKFNFIESVAHYQKTQYALKIMFSPNSKVLTIIGSHGMIKVYAVDYNFVVLFDHIVKTPKSDQNQYRNNHPWVRDLTYSSDSKYLYFGASDGYTRKWKIGEEKYELIFHPVHSKPISAIAFYDGEI